MTTGTMTAVTATLSHEELERMTEQRLEVPPPMNDNSDKTGNRRPIETEAVDQVCCFLCGEEGEGLTRCPDCGLVWYCGEDHREIHRPENKCFPFVIKRSPEKGR